MAQQFKVAVGLNDKDASKENPFKFSHSHGLPPELLSKIFILATPTRNIVTDMDFPVEVSDYKTILAISQACNYWRTVALATPQIWSSISVVRSRQLVSTGFVALTRTVIERSKNLPLHITIDIGNQEQTQGKNSWITTLFQLIFSQAYRWKSAIIRFEGHDFGKFPRLDLPILESLSYKRVYPSTAPRTGPKIFDFGDTPSLRHVILDGPDSQIPLPWGQILNYIGLPRNLEIMRPIGSQLQTCGFRGAVTRTLGIQISLSPIVFTKLTSLRLINHAPHSYSLFRGIVSPVLENLEIRTWNRGEEASLVINKLIGITLASSSTTLRSLSFHVRGMTAELLERLLYATPCLTTLDICDAPVSVFACLGARPSNDFTGPLVPRLQSLVIHNFSHSDAAALFSIYDSRHPLNDDMGVAHLDITLSYRSFRACHRAHCRIAEEDGVDSNASRLGKILGWCSHLVKQFIIEKKEIYAVPGTKKSPRRVYHPSELNVFFSKVLEMHQFSDPSIIEISRIAKILSDIKDLPSTAILDDNDYQFRQRAEKLLNRWTPLLEDLRSRQRWTLGEDHLTLRICSPTAICSLEH